MEGAYHNNKWYNIRSAKITKVLRSEVKISGLQVGFKTNKLSAILICVGGAMFITLERVDTLNHTSGGAVEERCHAPLPPHVRSDLQRRSSIAHDPTWGLCYHPSRP